MTAGRTINSQSQDWGTPRKYVEAVKRVLGGDIDLDPCSNARSIVHARTEYVLPRHDGLRESWDFRRIYVNPPYGADRVRGTRIKDWLRRCADAHKRYGSEVIALVPVATNTSHWKEYVWGKATAVCFLYDTRLRFLVAGKDVGKGAPMSCAMVYWGENFEKFLEVFTEFGAVVDLGPLKGRKIGHHSRMMQPALLEDY
ncbi:MAG: DNA N-6-adenine-methyltransferase [Planctomycetota bacterium]|nr:DNA N-6-adenine-methyltransferase [Planctomycetota bacterium]